ncbi:MAG: WD repeat protein [Hyperionvirus sp.]|uniref:WD repeat protein n=1 Tax=Hyperionvirus sp. TaxID=2487770 RepID=A0A3G5AB95_9VIRU|nr:MAG: WD repeat protein [Hyperionvirus sp.]
MYTVSFSLGGVEEEKKMKEYFDVHGYVVVRDVLTVAECKATYEEIGGQLKKLNEKFDIDDLGSYGEASLSNYGLYSARPIFSKQVMRNRENENIYRAFSILSEEKDLIVNQDRCCLYRPTRGVLIGGELVDKPEWKTSYSYPELHLDFHPSTYVDIDGLVIAKRDSLKYSDYRDFVTENNLYCSADGLQLQGVINVLNNSLDDGGFHCVPGFTNYFEEWYAGFRDKIIGKVGSYHFSNLDKNDMKYVSTSERITAARGSIIIWNQKMAHGSRPNNSNRSRCCQFIKMFPRKTFSKSRFGNRQKAMKKILSDNDFEPSDIGKIVFGL